MTPGTWQTLTDPKLAELDPKGTYQVIAGNDARGIGYIDNYWRVQLRGGGVGLHLATYIDHGWQLQVLTPAPQPAEDGEWEDATLQEIDAMTDPAVRVVSDAVTYDASRNENGEWVVYRHFANTYPVTTYMDIAGFRLQVLKPKEPVKALDGSGTVTVTTGYNEYGDWPEGG